MSEGLGLILHPTVLPAPCTHEGVLQKGALLVQRGMTRSRVLAHALFGTQMGSA
jgi:hypothetical protein